MSFIFVVVIVAGGRCCRGLHIAEVRRLQAALAAIESQLQSAHCHPKPGDATVPARAVFPVLEDGMQAIAR